MNQSITIGIAALLAGGVGGFLTGRSASGSSDANEFTETAATAKVRPTAKDSKDSLAKDGRARVRTVAEALESSNQMGKTQALIDLYTNMSEAELEAALEDLSNLPMQDRVLASILLFSRWAEIDPKGALAQTRSMGFTGGFAAMTVLRDWASTDPVNAAKYYAENPDQFAMMGGPGGFGGGGAGTIAREWAALDPEAAMNWAKTLTGRDQADAMVSVVGSMAATDPAKAVTMAAQLGAAERTRAYQDIAEQWAAKDFASAERWINTLSGEAKDGAMANALGALARTDPEAAAAKIGPGSTQSEAIGTVAREWSQKDPAAAAGWLVGQSAPDLGGAMRPVMGNWIRQDSAGALAFIQQQPQGEMRDSATQSYLWMNRNTEPAQAMQLVQSISSDRDRNRMAGEIGRRWMQEDPAAAQNYIQNATFLGDRAKNAILNGEPMDGGRGNWPGRGRR